MTAKSAGGLWDMVVASLLFPTMSALVYAAELRMQGPNSLLSSFVRIEINLLLVALPFVWRADWRGLFGDARPSLWARGFFGALSLMTSFAAVKAIGVGETAFLHASNTIIVAMLSPFILGQRHNLRAWVAIGGSIVGLYLLLEPRLNDAHPYGRALGLASGVFGALAYLMVARAGRSNSPNIVIFYFCLVATILHLGAFAWFGVHLTDDWIAWSYLIAAGVIATVAQFFLTRAYQRSAAALTAAISFLGPVVSMVINVAIFAKFPDEHALLGAGIVLCFGVLLPFARMPRLRHAPAKT